MNTSETIYREMNASPEKRLKANEYQRKYREMTASTQKNPRVMNNKENTEKEMII